MANTSDNETRINSTIDAGSVSMSIEAQIIFYLYLLVDVPSIICSLLLFFYFFYLIELRRQHYSHQMVMYLLLSALLLSAVDIPLLLPYLQNYFYVTSMKYPKSFCIFWMFYDYTIWSMELWMMALLSAERYLLIFFKPLVMKNKIRCFLLYYFPVVVIFLFFLFWYMYLLMFYPCEQTHFDFTQIFCAFSCYEIVGSESLRNFDWIISNLLPVFLTVLFTLILILHVLYQKHKIGRHLMRNETWKRTRKMFIQLLPITFIFLFFTMPLIVVGLLAVSYPWFSTTPYYYVVFLSYGLPLCTPFAVLSKQPIVKKRLFALFRRRRLNQIPPMHTNDMPMRFMRSTAIQKLPTKVI